MFCPLTLGRYLRIQQVRSGMSSMRKLLSIVYFLAMVKVRITLQDLHTSEHEVSLSLTSESSFLPTTNQWRMMSLKYLELLVCCRELTKFWHLLLC